MTTVARVGCLVTTIILWFGVCIAGGPKTAGISYKVLSPVTQDNLTVFPVVTESTYDTHNFLTLDEGLRSGSVVVTEEGGSPGLVRPRRDGSPGVWEEHAYPQHPRRGAEVNRLMLTNNSDRPLILLAGEIVMGGKQDRVVGKDRLIPAKSEPIDLSVFCVEPHRWVETSALFGGASLVMAQPSVRLKAMANKDQQAVWDEVAKSRKFVADAVSVPASQAIAGSSSYAKTMENREVQNRMNAVAAPIQRSYDKLMRELHAQNAVGAVVAVNGEIVWADIFASASLLEKYWPKLIRSYAAEAVSAWAGRARWGAAAPSAGEAQHFLDDFDARRESVESEPAVYRNTEMVGRDFDAFVLTSLLPGTGFNVHIAKMRQ
jgi:ARG and Rhodanese-Phosphatase-superfamily-associated Protein domain